MSSKRQVKERIKLQDVSPIFLYNLKYKVFCYSGHDTVQVVKLECIKPTKQLIHGEIYWAYEDTSSNYWYYEYNNGYPVYKIFLEILGCRKYNPNRFKVLDKITVYKKDFK